MANNEAGFVRTFKKRQIDMIKPVNDRIPWWEPQIGREEYDLVKEVLDSNFLNDGEFTSRFERQLAQKLGVKHVVAVSNGTTALFAALAGLGLGPGDEVLAPDVTFIATANAVSLTGARPVLVDVDEKRLTIDVEAARRALTRRTRAIIPVHVSGRGADMSGILNLAREHQLYVIEDAAEALLSRQNGVCLGTMGAAGCFSFSPNKTVMCGQGGAAVTNNDQLNVRMREIKDQGRPVRGTGGNDIHESIGYNFKLTNLQAAVGLAQLDQLENRVKKLKQIYRWYRAKLNDIEGIDWPGFDLARGESPQWVDILLDERDALFQYLAGRNIDCRCYWHPLHTQKPYRLPDDKFVNSTRQAPRALWLPSAFTLSEDDIDTVCRTVREFRDNRRKKSNICQPSGAIS